MKAPHTPRISLRLPEHTRRLIRDLREALGLQSDAQIVILAVERMARDELR